ncbi:MAG: protein-glutamate O-methyltransferase CheR [Oscillibacter sp.]|nr:protein-glutamate O-methyltransferase CheR [Oscillibacter sp.]
MTGQEKKSGGAFTPMVISEADFKRMASFIQSTYGIDLTQKRQLVTGRLSPAIRKLGYANFSDFVNHVLEKKENAEITLILNKLTTNYTFFMREQEHLDYFTKNIIPEIVRRHQRDKSLAIWSAGCSSGEEPYNLTMLLYDYLGPQAKQWDTKLLATDISAQALTKAQRGIYTLPDTIPLDWKRKYFKARPDGTHAVTPEVRENVIFKTFNLMDPINFRRKFDVIFCRNVMIYFDQPTKDALVRRFYDATVPNGYLLISYSETLSQNSPYRRLATATYQK